MEQNKRPFNSFWVYTRMFVGKTSFYICPTNPTLELSPVYHTSHGYCRIGIKAGGNYKYVSLKSSLNCKSANM